MKYHELQTIKKKTSKRVGRGIASGKGKTAGRGTKGQGARTGSTRRPGFEGGQNPLMQQLPKLPGFHSLHPKALTAFTGELHTVGTPTITAESLFEAGLIESPYQNVKLLIGRGDINKKLTVKLQGASAGAIAAIEAAGGTFEEVPRIKRITKNKESA